jgi:hypothetical protein
MVAGWMQSQSELGHAKAKWWVLIRVVNSLNKSFEMMKSR